MCPTASAFPRRLPIGPLCDGDHHPGRSRRSLAVRRDAPRRLQPQLRDRYQRGHLHRRRNRLLHPHDGAFPGGAPPRRRPARGPPPRRRRQWRRPPRLRRVHDRGVHHHGLRPDTPLRVIRHSHRRHDRLGPGGVVARVARAAVARGAWACATICSIRCTSASSSSPRWGAMERETGVEPPLRPEGPLLGKQGITLAASPLARSRAAGRQASSAALAASEVADWRVSWPISPLGFSQAANRSAQSTA